MTAKTPRVTDCTPAQARSRQQAEAFVMAADLVISDATNTATPGVAAALAVLAGIAASDAACCAKLFLAAKDESQYGLTLLDRTKARRLIGYARRMTELSRQVVEA